MLENAIKKKKEEKLNIYIKDINKKNNHMFKSFLITISILAILLISGTAIYAFNYIKKINKENLIKSEKIRTLKIANGNLGSDRRNLINQINQLQKEKNYLIKNKNINQTKNKVTTKKYKPKKIATRQKKDEIIYYDREARQTKTKQIKNINKNQYYKKYQNFSNSIELISDSKIRKQNNNKLQSNAAIYGRYHPVSYSVINPSKNQITNIQCGLKNNTYNVVDECSMNISNNFDKVYLGTMNAKSIKEFDYKTHMIECDYNKEYGMMHDCKIKMI